MVYKQWQKITDIVEETARLYSIDEALYLASRLIGMNDERIVRILGDYDNEPVPETSIKGMLNRILIALQTINARMETVELNVETVADNTTAMLKYGEFRANNSDYWDTHRREMLQAYYFRNSRVYGQSGGIFEFTNPMPVRVHPTHSGVAGNFVRVPQNGMLGLEPQVVHSFRCTSLRYGKWYNPPWMHLWLNFYSSPEYTHSAHMLSLSPSVVDGNQGVAIFHAQMNYLNPETDYVWIQALIAVPESDWSYQDFMSDTVTLRIEQHIGQMLG